MVPRLALIHATQLAIDPIQAAFERLWPEARRMNVLDDCLSRDLAERGNLDARMYDRVAALGRYAVDQGASGILFTCSAFGPAIDAAAASLGVPVLKPNEAMFAEAAGIASSLPHARIALVTTFAPAAKSLATEFLSIRGQGLAQLECAFAEGAMDALARGDACLHDRLIADAAAGIGGCDVVMLGQFSMARAQARVAAAVSKPVLSSPDSAVRALKRALHAEP